MAKKTINIDVYEVVDNDGNVVQELRYPEGGSLYQGALEERARGIDSAVYQTNKEGDEIWTPVREAKTSVSIDPIAGKITVTGPKWLTAEVVNSESFKKNYTDNSALKQLMSLYQQNTKAVIPDNAGGTMSVAEALRQFEQNASNYMELYPQIKEYKLGIESRYGVTVDDDMIQVFLSPQSNKGDTYDKTRAIYIPESMLGKYNLSQYASWNEKDGTLSAEDFFKLYSADELTDETLHLNDEMEKRLEGFLYNANAIKTEEEDETLQDLMNSDEYKEELVRTLAMYSTTSINKPDTTATLDAALFTWGTMNNFAHDAANAGYNISASIMQGFDTITKDIPGGQWLNALNPVYTGAYLLGSLIDYFHTDSLKDGVDRLYGDWEALCNSELGNRMQERGDDVRGYYEKINKDWENASDWWVRGEMVGSLCWKIAENLMVLNTVGGTVGNVVSKTLGLSAKGEVAGGVAAFLGKFASNKVAVNVIKAVALAANVTAQGVLETLIDNKDLVDKAIESGEMTDELWAKVKSNIWWNFIGEGAAGHINWALTETTPGKVASMAMLKGVNKAAYAKNTILGKLANSLNKFTTDSTGAIVESAGKTVPQYWSNVFAAQARANKIIADLPIFKALDAEGQQALKDGWRFIVGDESAEQFAKIMAGEGEAAEGLSTIDRNYLTYQKAVLMRANLENNIDAIGRGVKVRMEEINAFSGKSFTEYNDSLNKVGELEGKAIKNGANLTKRADGSILTKESSEYLSYSSQIGRVKYTVDNKMLKGSELAKAEAYLEGVGEKLKSLRGTLGDELADALDTHLVKMADYNKKILDYMITKGYASDAFAEKIFGFRNNAGWGPDGMYYIPTRRIFNGQSAEDVATAFNKELESPDIFRTKTVGDDPHKYKFGNLDDTFVDPNMVIFGQLRAAAAVAQGADMARAMMAVGVASRVIKSFDGLGESSFEKTMVEKGMKGLRGDFKSLFDLGSKESKAIKNAFTNAFGGEEAVYAPVFKQSSESNAAARTAGAAKTKMNEAKRTIDTLLKDTTKKSIQKASIASFTGDELDTLFATTKAGVEAPDFNIGAVSGRAGYKEWYSALPERTQKEITKRLAGQKNTLTNFRSLVKKNQNFLTELKQDWLKSADGAALRESEEFKVMAAQKIEANMNASSRTVLARARDQYAKAQERYAKALEKVNPDFKASDAATYGEDFVVRVKAAVESTVDEATKAMAGNDGFKALVKQMTDAGMDADDAARYIVLHQLNGMKDAQFKGLLSQSARKGAKMAGYVSPKTYESVKDAIASGVKEEVESSFNLLQNELVLRGFSGSMDMETYWKSIEGYMDDLMQTEGKWLVGKNAEAMNRHIVQMVSPEGDLRYYEVDPLTAYLTNNKPNVFEHLKNRTKLGDLASGTLRFSSQVFRWGTTGIDRTSFINQWFKDSFDATFVGAAKPFTDLGPSGAFGKAAAAASDYIPFGEKVFGKAAVSEISNGVVTSTFKNAEEGILKEFGEDVGGRILKELRDGSTAGLTGDMAEAAYRRAVAEFAISDTGYNAVPGLGGMTEAQYYRASTGKNVTAEQVRKEEIESVFGKMNANTTETTMRKFGAKLDELSVKTSRGQWRETFMRQSVFTTNYKAAIKSGMSAQEAKIWATRFALDATTDFGRGFAYGNSIFRNVPYLGAAINGNKSFWRLLEIDPAGVSSRITYGLILPYMTLLTESLSDPNNRKVYETIKEYEKENSMFLIYNGVKVSFPIPEQLSAILAPFRHTVEKFSGANDNSWLRLAASDALGMLPLDLSGFVELDAQGILADDRETGLGSCIQRGVEKAASSLMPPVVKGAYMMATGRDPYTGQEIDKSYTILDDEGNEVPMDNTQSALAKFLADKLKCPASSAYAVLKNVFGRSTVSVLDGAIEALDGSVSAEEWANNRINEAFDQLSSPIGKEDYDKVYAEWNKAISALYDMRKELLNDEGFQKAYNALQNPNTSDEKRQGALNTYKAKLDEWEQRVLKTAKNLKDKYPEYYTDTRLRQIVSLMTLPQGYTYSETEAAAQHRSESYYDARERAVDTLVRLGFSTDTVGPNPIGYQYYNSNNELQVKIYSPYEIERLNSMTKGAAEEMQAQIVSILKAADLTTEKRWELYNKATTKAERKQIQSAWNEQVVRALLPLVEKYGIDVVINSGKTRELLDDYIWVSNPYKTKEYLYEIFGGQ